MTLQAHPEHEPDHVLSARPASHRSPVLAKIGASTATALRYVLRAVLRRALAFVRVCEDFADCGSFRNAAALSYYGLFSLPAVVAMALVLAKVAYQETAVRREVLRVGASLLGEEAHSQLALWTTINRMPEVNDPAVTLVAFGALVYAATRGLAQLREALNDAWGVRESPNRGTIRSFLLERGLAAIALIGVALVFALSWIARGLVELIPFWSDVGDSAFAAARVASETFSLMVLTAALTLLHRFVPDVHLTIRQAMFAGFLSAALITLGRAALGYYLSTTEVASAFGAASGLAALLLALYVFSMMILFSAVSLKHRMIHRGEPIVSTRGAHAAKAADGSSDQTAARPQATP